MPTAKQQDPNNGQYPKPQFGSQLGNPSLMKNVILISTLGASVASSAYGAIAFNTVSSANWQT
ncbi:MAG: hypothetical protein ACKOQZ_05160, partial [Actinomycetota bacterium]